MISAEKLCFSYGQKPVLRDISFHLPGGGLTALLGGNGAGKTTLFRCMLGMLEGYTGSIRIRGKDLKKYSAQALAHEIAYIPQSCDPVFRYTVLDMVLMGTAHRVGVFHSPGVQENRDAMEALERLGMEDMAQRDFSQLSGGERQMVLIARALAQKTSILFMDEPCASLDFGNQSRVMRIACELGKAGYTVLMSTHHPQHVLSCADHVLALCQGRLIGEGAPDEILNEELTEKMYGVPVCFLQTEHGRIVVPRKEDAPGK